MSRAEIVSEKMYSLGFGQYSAGVLLREELMKEVAKLRAKQIHEMKKLLALNLDLLEVEEWALVGHGHHSVIYYDKNNSNKKKLNRIDVLDHVMPIEYKAIVFAVDGEDWRERQKAAKSAFIEHMTKTDL